MDFLPAVFHFFTTRGNWTGSDGALSRLYLQVELSAASVGVAAFIGVSGGFLLGHFRRGVVISVNAANAARAVPSIALLTILVLLPGIAFRGGGFLASFITLVALGIPPILTNSYVGMREVDAELREAARAMGMSGWQMFFKVEVPLALPLAVAGVRTAAVEIVATSTLAAYVTFDDLGEYIFAGLATNDPVETFAGAVLVAALAGVTDLGLVGLARIVTPIGLRRAKGRASSIGGRLPAASIRAIARIRGDLSNAA